MSDMVRYAPVRGALQLRNFTDATDEDIRAVAPAVFAEAPGPDRSSRYQFVSTIQLINAMRQEGWMVTAAGQKYVTDEERHGYARHMVRMRHQSFSLKAEAVPEGIIMNAHDGTASWKYFDGVFRFVCANGCVFGEVMGSVKAHHTVRQAGANGETAMRLSEEFMRVLPGKMKLAERLKEVRLTELQMTEYFTKAIAVRWPHGSSITSNDVATFTWLKEDYGLTAWQVYNHAQRVLVTLGGVQGVNAAGRVHVSNPVKRIEEMVRINVGLWDAMLEYCPDDIRVVPKLEPEQV
jgi:hypothetical protein